MKKCVRKLSGVSPKKDVIETSVSDSSCRSVTLHSTDTLCDTSAINSSMSTPLLYVKDQDCVLKCSVSPVLLVNLANVLYLNSLIYLYFNLVQNLQWKDVEYDKLISLQSFLSFRFSCGSVSVCTRRFSLVRGSESSHAFKNLRVHTLPLPHENLKLESTQQNSSCSHCAVTGQ